MDKAAIKLSVTCMAYNHEEYIRDALEGFVSQRTDFPFEVLISDDASTDGTAAIIREYAEKYPHIIHPFFQEKNLFSQGIDPLDAVLFPAARGQYLAACEGDDCWTDPEKLQRQVDFLDAHPDYSACVHNSLGQLIGSGEEPRPLFPSTGDRDVGFDTTIRGMSHSFHTSSIVARREWIVKSPDFRYVGWQYQFTDYAVAIWLSMQGKIRFLDRCMSLYRIGSNPGAWSSGVGQYYDKRVHFVTGEREMLKAVLPHVSGEQRAQTEAVIREREFELAYLQGRTEELVKPVYRDLFRAKPLSFRLATRLKNAFPRLHRLYRKKRGYGE